MARKPEDMWWVINGAEILAAFESVQQGTAPDIAYLELLANSEAVEG